MASHLARRSIGLTLIASPLCALAIAASPAAAASGDIRNVCQKGTNSQRVISLSGARATCAEGVPVLNAWRKADRPKRFRSFTCGEVKATKIGFHAKKRWFATDQCVNRAGIKYILWTRY
jgi:hypothetical protein